MATKITLMAREWNDGGKWYLIYGNIAIEYSTINQFEIEKNSQNGVKSMTIVMNCEDEENRWVGHGVTISFSDSKEGQELIATQSDIFQSDTKKRCCMVRRGIARNGFLFGKYEIFPESRYKINTILEKEENENESKIYESESGAMMSNGNSTGVSLNEDIEWMVFASGSVPCDIANNGILLGKYQSEQESEYKVDTRLAMNALERNEKGQNDAESNFYESVSFMKSPRGLPCRIVNDGGILFDKYQTLHESQRNIDIRSPNILANVGSRNMNLTSSNVNSIDSLACNIEEKIDDNALCREKQEKTFNNHNSNVESIYQDDKEISRLMAIVKCRGMVKKVLDGDIDRSVVFARFGLPRDAIGSGIRRFFEDKLCEMKGLREGIIEDVGYIVLSRNELIAVFMIANYGNKAIEIYQPQKKMVITHLRATFGNDKIWFDSYAFPENASENRHGSGNKNIQRNLPVVTNIREFQRNAALANSGDAESFFIKFGRNDMNNNNNNSAMNDYHENMNKVISMNSNIVKPCGITFSPNGQQVICFLLSNFSHVNDATFKNEKEILVKNLNEKYYGSIWFRDYPPNPFENEKNESDANDNDENIKKLSNKELITYWESEEANNLKKDYFDKMKQFLEPILTYVRKNGYNINSGFKILARLKENSGKIQMLDEKLHLSDDKYLKIFDLLVNEGFENFEHKFWSVKSKFFNDNRYFRDNNLLGMNWDVEYYVCCNLPENDNNDNNDNNNTNPFANIDSGNIKGDQTAEILKVLGNRKKKWCENKAAAIALQNEIDVFKARMSVEQSRCHVVSLIKIIICCHSIMELRNGGE